MALSRFRGEGGDWVAGQQISIGGQQVMVPAAVLVDASGNDASIGGTAVAASSGDVANASAVATLAAPGAGLTNYVTGFTITFSGATAASVVLATLTGLLGGTLS